MDKLNIAVLEGTTRKQRKSIRVAKFVCESGEKIDGVTVKLVDPTDFNFEGDGNDPEAKDPKYTEITEWADGFFIIVPEYNHSFPGSLKRMLDSELKNYIHKPVAFAGVSSGRWGGIRAIESMLSPVRTMGLVATFTDMQFPNVDDLFDEDGVLQNESYNDYIKKAWAELIWMAKAMKHARKNLPPESL